MSFRLLHLSDPHFGTERAEAVAAAGEAAARLAPDLVVLSGDVTQRARRAQFEAAAQFMAGLGEAPQLLIPGNHDIPLMNLAARVLHPYRGFREHFGASLNPHHRLGEIAVFGFTSCPPWRHKHGELDPRAMARALAAQAGGASLRVAVLHHPLDCRLALDEHNLLRGAGAVVHGLAAHGVDLVLGGHIHDPYVSSSAARYPGTRRAMVLALAGTCVSRRTRRGIPNSFNLIRLDPGPPASMVVERHDYDEIGQRFSLAASLGFMRGEHGVWGEVAAL